MPIKDCNGDVVGVAQVTNLKVKNVPKIVYSLVYKSGSSYCNWEEIRLHDGLGTLSIIIKIRKLFCT